MSNQILSNKRIEEINNNIIDRTNTFYWQTDRSLTPQEAGIIWADRHKNFTDDEIFININKTLSKDNQIKELVSLNLEAQENIGNVNSVRIAILASGKQVIIRLHPKGIRNGYFHAESLAAYISKEHNIPSYSTISIHDFESANDFSFQVIEKLAGSAIKKWLEKYPNDENKLLFEVGQTLAKVNQIKVTNFGPFSNEKAKKNVLIGLHESYAKAIQAGLDFNLIVLKENDMLTDIQINKIEKLFSDENPSLRCSQPVLIHNDFADWNLLTDGNKVTGVIDWDECVGGDFISEIACWSTFFEPSRLNLMLNGYWTIRDKPADYQDRFELLRLRYILSKMTLRIRRYSWDPSDFIREKISTGKIHLSESLKFFNI